MSATASAARRVLVHLGAGIGDVVLATPLLVALEALGAETDVALHADYPETAGLLDGWSAVRSVRALAPRDPVPPLAAYDVVVPAVPPFYWARVAAAYRAARHAVPRPPDALFHRDARAWYLAFAHALGFPRDRSPACRLPIAADGDAPAHDVVLAPGCKTGIMAAKRWPHFAELAERLAGACDVAVVGTPDDVRGADGRALALPAGVRSYVGARSLRGTAELLAAARCVVANDSGLAHVAAAVGAPTVLLFGPTPDDAFGGLPPNATVLRAGLACEPCWAGARLGACGGRVDCLRAIPAARVEREVRRLLGLDAPAPLSVLPAPLSVIPANAGIQTGAWPPACAGVTSRAEVTKDAAEAPLVSCLMPTCDRHAFVAQAVRYFLRQDYPRRELVVVDDGAAPAGDLLPDDPRVRYVRLPARRTVGAKRNLACEAARGDLLVHWDDDDWMAPDRLTRQVAALLAALAAAGARPPRDAPAACGLARLPFVDPARGLCWEYAHEGRPRPWVAGGTLGYTRALWARRPFPDVREGEDTRFVWGLGDAPLVAMDGPPFYAAIVHGRNTSRKRTDGARWRPRPLDEARRLIGADWAFYERLATASGA